MEKFWGSFFVCRAAAPLLAKTGSITLTSSVSILKPSATGGVSVMSAASGAVATFGRTLAAELAPVRVNVIAPGVVNTGVWDGSSEEQRTGLRTWAESSLPVKHLAEPEEVAGAFIALMLNPYITGALLPVDGGHSLT
jgi:NAD(P)-dependent dehydrogenase (short-subunit alcohol dehydrogenase family)